MENIIIRQATAVDAQVIETICLDMWKVAYKDVFPKTVFEKMEEIKEFKIQKTQNLINNNQTTIFVIEDNNEIKSFIAVSEILEELKDYDIKMEVVRFYSKPNENRKGYGSLIFEQAKKYIKELGYSSFILWCVTDNKMGMNFYINKQKGEPIASREIDVYGYKTKETGIKFNI